MQKYTKYVKICKNHPRHLYKFLLGRGRVGGSRVGTREEGKGIIVRRKQWERQR